jgi:hypothetical protein
LRESHRLGGPIFKFNKLFKELETGVLHTDFRFRNGDLLFDMGENYRSALRANRERILAIRQIAEEAEKAAREAGLPAGLSHEETQRLRLLVKNACELAERIKDFDLGNG